MSMEKPDSIQFDPALAARLEALAAENGLTVDELVSAVLHAHVEQAEADALFRRGKELLKKMGGSADDTPAWTKKPLHEMNAAERMHRRFVKIGFKEGEFELPDRSDSGREIPDFL